MTSMVEKVARAMEPMTAKMVDRLIARGLSRSDGLSLLPMARARAAIEAMREPTEAMVNEAGDTAHHEDDTLPFKVVFDKYWHAAIDAALSEQERDS